MIFMPLLLQIMCRASLRASIGVVNDMDDESVLEIVRQFVTTVGLDSHKISQEICCYES